VTAPAAVTVTCWGELRGEKKLRGVLRVLADGQQAGAIERAGDGWVAQVHGLRRSQPTSHATASDAVRATLRSSWARRLGARKASAVYWSKQARKAAR